MDSEKDEARRQAIARFRFEVIAPVVVRPLAPGEKTHLLRDLHGAAPQVTERRAAILADAYARHPERFVNGQPYPQAITQNVWINRPDDTP